MSVPSVEQPPISVALLDAAQATGDVLVIPCSTEGSFGTHWAKVLRGLGVSEKPRPMRLGGVRTRVVLKKDVRFRQVAFAATVSNNPPIASEPGVIRAIGGALGSAYFRSMEVQRLEPRTIVSPVPGTGYGELDLSAAFHAFTQGFLAERDAGTTLTLITNDPDQYDELQRLIREVDTSLRPPRLARAAADSVPVRHLARHDRLDLAADVEMLASIALARSTEPPLAIGLFGHWGSGKSFFMAMLRERLDEIAAASGVDGADTYCHDIRQITFNAWHYAEDQLWPSLAAAIFGGLGRPPGEAEREARAQELSEAVERAEQARLDRVAREEELREAELTAVSTARDPAALLDQTARVLRRHGGPEVQRLIASLDDAGSDTRRRWSALAESRRELVSGWRLAVLVVSLTLTVGLFATMFVVGLPALVPVVGTAAAVLGYAASVAATLREARVARERPVRDALAALAAARAEEALAAEEVRSRQDDIARLRDRGERLQQLVQDAQTTYATQLGTISQLRADLELLAALVHPDDREDPSVAALRAGAQAVMATDPASSGNDLDVDRIVLYIDDLDRCPPDVVVKVLEAVNMLLAFRLFVVVIGVDGRWLEKSLKRTYRSLLDDPMEYLEKIVQLPFVLRPMSGVDFGNLVDALTSGGSDDDAPVASPAVLPDLVLKNDDVVLVAEAKSVDGAAIPAPGTTAPTELVAITDAERRLLRELAGFITTPRTLKRLVNAYRMIRVRAGRAEDHRLDPGGGAEYEVVIVLLALQLSCPSHAGSIFSRVMVGEQRDFWEFVTEPTPGSKDAQSPEIDLCPTCAALSVRLRDQVGEHALPTYRRWIPLVSRFSYQLSSVIPAGADSV